MLTQQVPGCHWCHYYQPSFCTSYINLFPDMVIVKEYYMSFLQHNLSLYKWKSSAISNPICSPVFNMNIHLLVTWISSISSSSIHLLHIHSYRQLSQRPIKIICSCIPTVDFSHAQVVETAGFIWQESYKVSSRSISDIPIFSFIF